MLVLAKGGLVCLIGRAQDANGVLESMELLLRSRCEPGSMLTLLMMVVQCRLNAVHHSELRVLTAANVYEAVGVPSHLRMFVVTLAVILNPEDLALSWRSLTGKSTEAAGLSTSLWDS